MYEEKDVSPVKATDLLVFGKIYSVQYQKLHLLEDGREQLKIYLSNMWTVHYFGNASKIDILFKRDLY